MKIPKLKPGDAVEVVWLDSNVPDGGGWRKESAFISDTSHLEIESACFLIKKDKEYIYTASDRFRGDEFIKSINRCLKIPLGCIKSIRRLT